jgi:hypothetical protein
MAVTAGNLVVGNLTVVIGTDVGALKDGATVTPTYTVFNVDIEQETFPSRFWYTDKKFALEFTMCEPTLENIKIAWDLIGAITAGPPRLLDIGTSAGVDFVPTARVIVLTSFTPSATGLLPIRTWNFHKCLLETPGASTITKRQETSLKTTWNCALDTAQTPDRVGQFSEAIA